MNRKEEELNRIVDIVVECCDTEGRGVITRDLVLGGSKRENIVMTRCLLVFEILRAGYTVTTCGKILNCSAQTVRMLMSKDGDFHRISRAYRLAKAEATQRCDAITE